MPELPQMQALSERIAQRFGGLALARVEPLQFSSLRSVLPSSGLPEGLPLSDASSRGKFLILDLGGPRLLIHLSQGGRVDLEEPGKRTRPKGGVVRLRFEDSAALLVKEFGTERKAGWWVLEEGDEGPLAALGPQPEEAAFSELIRSCGDSRRLHTMLRDQKTVAGIGRGYTDDILHRARLSPFSSLSGLEGGERESLLEAIGSVLAGALASERRRTGGLPPKLSDVFAIHGRWGRPCPRCGADLRRVSYESHEITYCPPCQTGGRILADRRLSRLIR